MKTVQFYGGTSLGTNALETFFADPFGRSTNRQTSVVMYPRNYGFDANGNLTNDGRLAYYWNDENRLVAVRDARSGALIQENRYDGLGRRREKVNIVSGMIVTNRYIYQGWLVLGVTDEAGMVLETYTHGADVSGLLAGLGGGVGGILASTQSGTSAYYHYDFNGNIVQVSATDKTLLAKHNYSPFGEVLLKEGVLNSRFQFSTKEYDSLTGLIYYGYRYYNPQLGRWLSRDPRGGFDGLYAFARNNAYSWIDPNGLFCIPFTTRLVNGKYDPDPPPPWENTGMKFTGMSQGDGMGAGVGVYTGYTCYYSRKVTKKYDKEKCVWCEWVADGTETKDETEKTTIDGGPDEFEGYGLGVIVGTPDDYVRYGQKCKDNPPEP